MSKLNELTRLINMVDADIDDMDTFIEGCIDVLCDMDIDEGARFKLYTHMLTVTNPQALADLNTVECMRECARVMSGSDED